VDDLSHLTVIFLTTQEIHMLKTVQVVEISNFAKQEYSYIYSTLYMNIYFTFDMKNISFIQEYSFNVVIVV
jgi:hypothetical protein